MLLVNLSKLALPTTPDQCAPFMIMGEFAFAHLLQVLIIKAVVNTVKNPQFNAISEQIHQTVAKVLKLLLKCIMVFR